MTHATYDGIPVDSRPLGEALPWERTYPSAPPRSALPEAFTCIYTRVCVSSPDLQRLHCSVSSRLFRHPISVRRGTKGLRAERAFWCMHAERAFSDGLDPGADKLRYHRAQSFARSAIRVSALPECSAAFRLFPAYPRAWRFARRCCQLSPSQAADSRPP